MSLLTVERALEAYRRLLNLDERFRAVMTQAVTARGAALDQCERELESLHPQLRRAQSDLAGNLLTLQQSYAIRVSVPVEVSNLGNGTVHGTLLCGCDDPPRVKGPSAMEVIRQLQDRVDSAGRAV